jgi:hypothetical protein
MGSFYFNTYAWSMEHGAWGMGHGDCVIRKLIVILKPMNKKIEIILTSIAESYYNVLIIRLMLNFAYMKQEGKNIILLLNG